MSFSFCCGKKYKYDCYLWFNKRIIVLEKFPLIRFVLIVYLFVKFIENINYVQNKVDNITIEVKLNQIVKKQTFTK